LISFSLCIYLIIMPVKREISLLPEENNPRSLPNRIVTWLTTVGRFVIVFVELIVVLAFLSRFFLDRKNADLSETIRQQKAILMSTKEFEDEYNQLQQRLKYIKDFYENEPQYLTKITSLVQSTPPDIVYDKFNITREKDSLQVVASLNAIAYEETSIVDFITNLILNPDIASVNIKSIEKKTKDSRYSIGLDLLFRDQKLNALTQK